MPTKTLHATREAWLEAARDALVPILEARTGLKAPKVIKLSCGWPTKPGKGAAGWCYESKAAADKASHIFVSPEVTDPRLVLAILAHELIHAADDCGSGHGGAFRKAHAAIGFEGKPTACTPGASFELELQGLARELGTYPHKGLVPRAKDTKTQGTRMIKVYCPDDGCGYTLRTTRKWIEVGLPTCPCGQPMVAELPDEETDDDGE